MAPTPSRKTVRLLLATNILAVAALLFASAGNPSIRKAVRKFLPKQPWNHEDNMFYDGYTAAYPLYQDRKNIVMLGNSLTAFADWGELLGRADVATRGVPSDVTAGYRARLGQVIALRPKVCFIEGGVNDLFQDISPDTALHNLSLLVSSLRQHGITPVLCTVSFVANDASKFPPSFNRRIASLNEGIQELASAEGVRLLDLNRLLARDGALAPEFVLEDGVHFTAKAYALWKREVEKIIHELAL